MLLVVILCMPGICGPPALASKYQNDRHGPSQLVSKSSINALQLNVMAVWAHTHTKKMEHTKPCPLPTLQYYCKTPTKFVWSVLNTCRNHYAHPEAELLVVYK